MTTPDELDRRLSVVEEEEEVARLREQNSLIANDAAAARVLAAGADHDVSEVRSELRGHTQALNALRETQIEHGRAIQQLDKTMAAGFAKVDENFAKVDEKFATMAQGMTQIHGLLERIAPPSAD